MGAVLSAFKGAYDKSSFSFKASHGYNKLVELRNQADARDEMEAQIAHLPAWQRKRAGHQEKAALKLRMSRKEKHAATKVSMSHSAMIPLW